MGIDAQEAIATGRQKRLTPYEKAILRYNKLRDAWESVLGHVLYVLEDEMKPNTGLNITRRDDGGFLAILKRDDDMRKEVIMAYGDDQLDALLSLEKKVRGDKWKVDTPWSPPKNSKK